MNEILTELNPIHARKSKKDFPLLGISLDGVKDFVESIGGPTVILDDTTATISINYVKPITKATNSSYCVYIQNLKPEKNYVNVATVFISHAWGYKFHDLLEALMTYNFPHDTYLWFDLFSNNQHLTDDPPPFDWWQNTFRNAIKEMRNVVMVASPWDNPLTLTRSWCLWEMYCAASLGNSCTFNVAMSKKEESKFIATLGVSTGKFYDMLGNVDVRQSKATKIHDQNQIFEVISKSIGFVKLNELIIRKLSEWVLEKVRDYIAREEKINVRFSTISDIENASSITETEKSEGMESVDVEKYDSKLLLAELLGRNGEFTESFTILRAMLDYLNAMDFYSLKEDFKFLKVRCLTIYAEVNLLSYGSSTFNTVNPANAPLKEVTASLELYNDTKQALNDALFFTGTLLFPSFDYAKMKIEEKKLRKKLKYSCLLCCRLSCVSGLSILQRLGCCYCFCCSCCGLRQCCKSYTSLKECEMKTAIEDFREQQFTSLLLKASPPLPTSSHLEWYLRTLLGKAKLLSMNMQESVSFSRTTLQVFQLCHTENTIQLLELRRYYATSMFNNGQFMHALREYEDILKTQRGLLPDTHPQIISTLVDLADLYNQLDQLFFARKYYQIAIPLMIEKFGSNSKHTSDIQLRYNKMEASFGNIYRALLVYFSLIYRRFMRLIQERFLDLIANIFLLVCFICLAAPLYFVCYLCPTMLRVVLFGWIPMKYRACIYKYIGFTRRYSDYYRAAIYWFVWIIWSAAKMLIIFTAAVLIIYYYLVSPSLPSGNIVQNDFPTAMPTITPTILLI